MKQLDSRHIPRVAPEDLAQVQRHPVCLVVENVRSAFNVGSMLRSADALRLDHVYLTGFSPPGDHRGVNKAALGAQDAVPWSHTRDTIDVLGSLKQRGYTLAAVEITDSPTDARRLPRADFPLALVVGNEVSGVDPKSLELCDLALELPQFGMKHSLNVAVAMGVVGYDVVRRWLELEPQSTAR
ncbi:MAG: hypothetical protein JJ896_18410 [Rhodothermales bacterium]|nr:hypothetical protein [Rhodothermales bacterium]MBO6781638.1 hypothetical protein [Rhodothermales bacterium]